MQKIPYRRHRLHPDVIRQAVWRYFRFTMGFRDVEDLLAERGIGVSHETVRLWVLKFGPAYARRIRKRRPVAMENRDRGSPNCNRTLGGRCFRLS